MHPPKYSQQWTPATVDKQVGVRSYQVITDDGRVYRRNGRHLRLTDEAPKQSPPDVEICSSDPGPLPLTKVDQVPPVAESTPQEVAKPQTTPNLQADDVTICKDLAPGEESYEGQHTSLTMNADTFPMLFMFSEH